MADMSPFVMHSRIVTFSYQSRFMHFACYGRVWRETIDSLDKLILLFNIDLKLEDFTCVLL